MADSLDGPQDQGMRPLFELVLRHVPPPTVEDPVAQIWPVEKTRHCTRLTVKMFSALASRRNPRPGFGFATASEAVAQSANTTRTVPVRTR